MIANTLMSARTPTPGPIFFLTIWPRVCRCRAERTRTGIIIVHSAAEWHRSRSRVPGKNPNRAAWTGPTRGPGPAIAAK